MRVSTFDESTSTEIETEDRDLFWVDKVHAEMLDEWESGDKTFL